MDGLRVRCLSVAKINNTIHLIPQGCFTKLPSLCQGQRVELSQGHFIHCITSVHKQKSYASFAKVPVHYKADQKHFSRERVGLKLGGLHVKIY